MNNDVIKEQLSVYVDNELPEEEQALLLRRLEKDPALRRQLSRYQLIHDAINHHLPDRVDLDFSDRVMSAIEREPIHVVSRSQILKKWAKPVSGFALAASVAMLAIIGGQRMLLDAYNDNYTNYTPEVAYSRYKNVSRMRWNIQPPEVSNSLNGYLVNHNEYTSSQNLQGMLPYVRIAGYDLDQSDQQNETSGKEDDKEK